MAAEDTELETTNTESEDTTEPSQENPDTKPEQVDPKKEPTIEEKRLEKRTQTIESYKKKFNEGEVDREGIPDWIRNEVAPVQKETENEMEDRIYNRLQAETDFKELQKTIPKSTTDEQYDAIDKIMDDADFQHLTKSKRLKYAMHEAGISKVQIEEIALQKGIQIGSGKLMGQSTVTREVKELSKHEKDEEKFMNTLPKDMKPKK